MKTNISSPSANGKAIQLATAVEPVCGRWEGSQALPILRIQGAWLTRQGWRIGEQVVAYIGERTILIRKIDRVQERPGEAKP